MFAIPLDRKYLDQDYENPGLPDSGLSLGELRAGLRDFDRIHCEKSPAIYKAEMFCYLLDHMRIGVSPKDIFVSFGTWGRKVFEEEILWPHRQKELVYDFFPEDTPRREELTGGKLVEFFCDYWHSVPDWEAIFSLGFPGLLARAKEAETHFYASRKGEATAKEKEFFLSIRMEYEAVLRLLDRTIDFAKCEACQKELIVALEKIRSGKPESFYELLLTDWIYYQLSEYADGIQARSFGNLDQILYPAYRHDLDSGVLTRDDVRSILGNYMYKVQAMKFYWGHPFYIGGTLPDGSSGVNELSRLILQVFGELHIFDPKIQIKLALNTPTDFINQALKLIRSGNNSLVFVGEPGITRAMTRLGYSEEEARSADIKGCYEYAVRAAAVETAPILLNLPNIIMKALRENRGAADYEQLWAACRRELFRCCDDAIEIANRFETRLDIANPAPLFSGTSARSLAMGVDGYTWGAKYNNSNVWLMGPATAANSLAMVKKYVFEQQTVSIEEFLQILDRDWQGAESLHAKILKDSFKYGNGNPGADEIMAALTGGLAEHIRGRKNGRGGVYTTALHSSHGFLYGGHAAGATPDGRRKGEEFTKNASVQSGSNRSGVTAMIRSALSLDPSRFAGDFPLDVMLHPSAVAGEDGLAAMRSLLLAYIAGYGHAIHFNVFNADMLHDAMKHPGKYADLQVRVCGWNVLWNNLSHAEQESYIRQAEAAGRGI